MSRILDSQFETQITYDTLQKGETLYNDVLNHKSDMSDFTLTELISFIAYGYYKMGLDNSRKGGK